MEGTTVRISKAARALLREMARREGRSMQAVLEGALEAYRRERLLGAINAGYAAPTGPDEPDEESRLWEGTLADGLPDREAWTDEGEIMIPESDRSPS